MKNAAIHISRTLLLSLLLTAALTGCDTTSDPSDATETITFEGRVTDDAGYGKQAGPVQDAVVTAAAIEADGSLTLLEGEATTDTEGFYSLSVARTSEEVVLTATTDAFRSDALAFHEPDGNDIVRVVPMTTESAMEASVYVTHTEQGTAGDLVTVADVAVYVNPRLAATLEAEQVTATEVAMAIGASAQAEADYLASLDEMDVPLADIRSNKESAFIKLQNDLHAAANASAQNEALDVYTEALIDAYSDAGVSLEAQAQARQSGRAALLKFFESASAEARFALLQQAEMLTALATTQGIEATFDAEGASQDRLEALADARTTLIASLKAAVAESEIEQALDTYETSVETEVMAELNINEALFGTIENVLATEKATLDAAVSTVATANAVAEAFATFYPNAESSIESTLAANEKAHLGAQVLTLLSLQ